MKIRLPFWFFALLLLILLQQPLHAQYWQLTGNAGTTPGSNFLGTTDSKALMFKVNNQRSGYIDFAVAKANTSFGFQALKSPTTGVRNAAFGYKVAFSITTGYNNTGAGAYALYLTTTGYSNVAVGTAALYRNTTGSNLVAVGDSALYNNGQGENNSIYSWKNTALGCKALYTNTIGYGNTATGYLALFSNTTGNVNNASGLAALYNNTTGGGNTASGASALYSNTTGYYNSASGFTALYSNTIGGYNTASGYTALYFNTTGNYNTAFGTSALMRNSSGNSNTASGYNALFSNSTGVFNTASGTSALYSNTTGKSNTASGVSALSDNTIGGDNTASGTYALQSNTAGSSNTASGTSALLLNRTGNGNTASGSGAGAFNDSNTNCTFLGYDADQAVATDFSNSMALGSFSRITASNQVRIGNTSISSIGGYEPWTDLSDGRFKKSIKENVKGLEFINKLKPVTYNLSVHELDAFLNPKSNGEKGDKEDKDYKALNEKAMDEKEKILYTGFVAQEVEKAAKEIGYDFNGVDAPDNEHDHYGLRYSLFVVPLAKAVQELSSQNSELKIQNDEQQKINLYLQKQIDELKAIVLAGSQSGVSNQQVTMNEKQETPKLEQNIPNPFNHATTINYILPQQYSSAKIIITDKNGKALKEANISGSE